MSLGIYPVFQPKLRGAKFEALGEVLAQSFEALDRIARTAKLTPFTAFADQREVPADFDGDPEDALELLGPWTEWFDAAEGKAAFEALANRVKLNPKVGRNLEDPSRVVEELEELARVLAVAECEGAKFRLEMS